MNRISYAIILSLIVGLLACSKLGDLNDLTIETPEAAYALPLLQASLTLEDVLDEVDSDANILIDDEGVLHFKYDGDVISSSIEDVFENLNNSIPPFIPVVDTLMELPLNLPNGIVIDKAILKSGLISYSFQSFHTDDMLVTVSIPQATKEGIPLQATHYVPPSDGVQAALPIPPINQLDLTGYQLQTESDSIFIRYEAYRNGERDTVSSFIMSLQNLAFSYAEGNMGNQIYEGVRDTLDLDFFSNWIDGGILFDAPSITVDIANSFGIPTKSLINQFDIIDADGVPVPLESQVITEGVSFNYPTIYEIGQTKHTIIRLDSSNSNIRKLLSTNPTGLIYDIDAITNQADALGTNQFITDSSGLAVNVSIDLPLKGTASKFTTLDTFDLEPIDLLQFDSAELKIITQNKMGLDVALQLYLLNDKQVVLDSLASTDILLLQAADVDNSGNVIVPRTTTNYIPLSATQLQALSKTDALAIKTIISTALSGQKAVAIKKEQGLSLQMGVIVQK